MSECDGCDQAADPTTSQSVLEAFLPGYDENFSYAVFIPPFPIEIIPDFSVFIEEHVQKVKETAEKLVALQDTKRIVEVLKYIKNRAPDSAYSDYLSRVTLFKHPPTRNAIMPPVSQVRPTAFFTTDQLKAATKKEAAFRLAAAEPDIPTPPKIGAPAYRDPEFKLAWWREDPSLNEHHYNWHVYYNTDSMPKDRQGELFAYMHEQALARYDFERLGVGLSHVVPYGPGQGWDSPLLEGYNGKLEGYSYRAANMNIPDKADFRPTRKILKSSMETSRERLHISIARNYLEREITLLGGGEDQEKKEAEITMHDLGCTVEANMGSINPLLYGNLHNNGHLVLAMVNDPDNRFGIKYGPMYDTLTAMRDPVFFRWHKYVDNIFEEYRQTLTPYNKPELEIGGVTLDSISVVSRDDDKEHLRKISEEERNNHLYTWMEYEEINVHLEDHKDPERVVKQIILQYAPFTYKFDVTNTRSQDALLCFRVFLCPDQWVPNLDHQKTSFIELDCFVREVKAGESQTVERESKESSVLMAKPSTVEDIRKGVEEGTKPYCGCGWPRNLLIPRGSPGGMKTKLFVLVTDWNVDAVDADVRMTGNVAFCGKVDAKYPDKKPMGYPFDRRFFVGEKDWQDIDEMVADVENSALAEVKITYMQD